MDNSAKLTVQPRSAFSKQYLVVVILSATAAAIARFACEQLKALDFAVFVKLALLSSTKGSPCVILVNSSSQLLHFLGFMLLAAMSIWASLRLAILARTFVLIDLVVLSLFCQWFLWQGFHYGGQPLGYVVAIVLGALIGSYLRSQEKIKQEQEAHYYELKIKAAELQNTKLELIKQDESERRLLAADLHDQVLNDLRNVLQKFEAYSESPNPETAFAIKSLVNQVMREIREIMDSLFPSVLEHLGLPAAIEDCLHRGSQQSGFKVRFRSKLDPACLEVLSPVEQSLLYRLVQESLTNICKHAGASLVKTSLVNEENNLIIRITDNGKGLDFTKAREDSRGLRYMRWKADLIGSSIVWKPGEGGQGTTVEIRVNLADKQARLTKSKE